MFRRNPKCRHQRAKFKVFTKYYGGKRDYHGFCLDCGHSLKVNVGQLPDHNPELTDMAVEVMEAKGWKLTGNLVFERNQ